MATKSVDTPPTSPLLPSVVKNLPILPLREGVLFPNAILPMTLRRPGHIELVSGVGEGKQIGIVAQRDRSVEEPKPSDLLETGSVGLIHRILQTGDDHILVFCEGLARFRVIDFVSTQPQLIANVELLKDPETPRDAEAQALRDHLIETVKQVIAATPDLPDDMQITIANISHLGRLADFAGTILPGLSFPERQGLLSELNVVARLRRVDELALRELERIQLRQKIHIEAHGAITQAQREFYLREQLKAIRKELGEEEGNRKEIGELRQKLEAAGMPEHVKEEALKELNRLSALSPMSSEYGVARNYLEWMVSLPWSVSTGEAVDVTRAARVLDEDHYDLEKVKDRILDFLAVLQLKPGSKGPILCFTGAPGVGKTSLGKSIARALSRKFVRISLGGMHDEAEIRGHRRTYIGALPGQIIHGIRRAGANDPVFMLDEIDKLGHEFHGDPASALLEVLDPEQNFSFRDNFLDVPFDLSKVLFITTANQLDTVPDALRDRMEVLELQGYTEQEKVAIAFRYLIPRQTRENGLEMQDVEFSEEALRYIIRRYTREAGVRNLERCIGSVCRKQARRIAAGVHQKVEASEEILAQFLGPPKFRTEFEVSERTQRPGVAVGLAWTPVGGDVLFVEAGRMPGGNRGLTMTGQLGSVMQESVQAALTWVRSHGLLYGIDPEVFARSDIHVHVPSGAIPKDGPSAGVTVAVALISSLTGRRVKSDFAMTGEITLTGLILPVGGIKEKVLAAKRSGIRNVAIPTDNEANVKEDLKAEHLGDLQIHYVRTMEALAELVLLPAE
ncbi:MAG: endopeptidase La [Bryobacterales bacterium]|nr:endopeptidase La [Bryobacterales bacterium]